MSKSIVELPTKYFKAVVNSIENEFPGVLKRQTLDIEKGHFIFLGIKFVANTKEQVS